MRDYEFHCYEGGPARSYLDGTTDAPQESCWPNSPLRGPGGVEQRILDQLARTFPDGPDSQAVAPGMEPYKTGDGLPYDNY